MKNYQSNIHYEVGKGTILPFRINECWIEEQFNEKHADGDVKVAN